MDISEITGVIDEDLINQSIEATKASNSGTDGFDSQVFLEIFLAQLQNQSPFDSLDTKDIAEQQAVLTEVEQVLRQTATLDDLSTTISENFTLLTDKLDEIKDLL